MTQANGGPSDRQQLRSALGLGADCPPVEQLELLLDTARNAPPALASHVESCTYCRAELSLLRRFQSDDLEESEKEPVRLVTERLAARAGEIIPGRPTWAAREPWWKALWSTPWPSAAALAMAGVLIALAVGLQWRHSQPGLHPPASSDQEVLRSNRISILSPAGDLRQVPQEVRWQAAPGAAKYDVRLLEVDGTEIWRADTSADRITLPPSVRVRIVPAKTLVWRVTASDASGHVVAESNTVRFRLLQNVYTP